CRDILKRSITPVAVENRSPVTGDEEIRKAIVIEVSCNGGCPVDIRGNACPIGRVCKSAVAVISEKMVVRKNCRRLLEGIGMNFPPERLAAGDVEVRKPIVVVVEPDA